jgi:hypothetical protein
MQIEIKPEDIDKLVKDALMKSALGDGITKAVRDIFASDRWDNPFKIALNDQAKLIVGEMMREPEFVEPLKAAVRKRFQDMVDTNVFEEAAKAIVTKMLKNADE